jgi:hypothetical protein
LLSTGVEVEWHSLIPARWSRSKAYCRLRQKQYVRGACDRDPKEVMKITQISQQILYEDAQWVKQLYQRDSENNVIDIQK